MECFFCRSLAGEESEWNHEERARYAALLKRCLTP